MSADPRRWCFRCRAYADHATDAHVDPPSLFDVLEVPIVADTSAFDESMERVRETIATSGESVDEWAARISEAADAFGETEDEARERWNGISRAVREAAFGSPPIDGPVSRGVEGFWPGRRIEDVPADVLARGDDPETSHAAARSLGGHAGTMRRRLLDAFAAADRTAEEAATAAGYSGADGAWKRVSDLLRAEMVAPTGETREATSGRQQRILRITEAGRRALLDSADDPG